MIKYISSGITVVLINLLLFSFIVSGQDINQFPKREFRGVWIASVGNIDWPTKAGMSAGQQKAELIQILDAHQRAGINAIMFQVRPAADALYSKGREPWSRYLSGIQGQAPSPFYDPLDFAISEAHSRGMELHAWINPYRATVDAGRNVAHNHITRLHPEWFLTYSGKKLFDPGLPEVRAYITAVVMDIVRNYDIDGIHFDDYFYPYPDKNPIPDQQTFQKYGGDFHSLDDWRRQNVNVLIKKVADSIKAEKPFVKFGISPFGIWDNLGSHPEGSATSGFSGYRQLYADAKKWASEGWIDYVNPQIYFPFNYRAAAFEVLVDWWAENSFGRHLYIGQAAYRANERGQGWRERDQLPRQIRYLRNNKQTHGSVFFSSKSLTNNMGGIRDSLQYTYYKYKTLPPTMSWLDDIAPLPPRGLTLRMAANRAVTLHWQKPNIAMDGDRAYGYVIYRFKGGDEIDLSDARKILHISYDNTYTTYTDDSIDQNTTYRYIITSLDRLKNESPPSNPESITIK